ncbi:sugar phosphate isomerase/epimerase family protein [Jiulongibacter sp. NS-SX5]|uniref:sugar phosphate isomerase/epimerase family protein n=1 Tax=Jiulongibacter sp. NS-SX5 TaxID=3463854 RepID=UPI00405983C8
MNRRGFIQNTALALGGLSILKYDSLVAQSAKKGPTIGAITYSFRSMDSDLDSLIGYCKECGISAIELMGDPVELFAGAPSNPIDFRSLFAGGRRRKLTDEEREQLDKYKENLVKWRSSVDMKPFEKAAQKLKANGISVYAFKPSTFGANNTDEEVEYGMKVANILGAKSVTLELPHDESQTLRLGKFAEKHGILVGYHAHTQATDTLWDKALDQSPNNTLNLDVGHYIAAGGNNTKESLLKLIEEKHDRISSIHMKDRQTKDNGAGNLAWGTGDTPICDVLNLLKDKGYDIPVSVELEYKVPENSDAVQEVKRCVDYAKSCLT